MSAAGAQEVDPNILAITYDVNGSSGIGGAVNSSLPLGPTKIDVKIDTSTAPTKIVDGTLTFPSSNIDFKLLGLPARAKVTLVQQGPVTGTLAKLPAPRQALDLQAQVKYTVKLSDITVSLLGIRLPLAVGSNCRTEKPATINVGSALTGDTPPAGFFTINGGGPLKSQYSIGKFVGCAPLNLLDLPFFFPKLGSVAVNSLVPNDNNTIQLQLDNPRPTE